MFLWTSYGILDFTTFITLVLSFILEPRFVCVTSAVTGGTGLTLRRQTLFDLSPHLDDFTRAQGALMLTYHAPFKSGCTSTPWLTTAVHYAKCANAHSYALMDHDSPRTNALKRLWWCCILRDRIMSLGLRRQLHIKPADFDFSQPGLCEDDFRDELANPIVYEAATKLVLVHLVDVLCQFAVVLNGVLTVTIPQDPDSKIHGHEPSHEQLQEWSHDLDCWYERTFIRFRIPTTVPGADESLILFTNMIYIYYKYDARPSVSGFFAPLSCS